MPTKGPQAVHHPTRLGLPRSVRSAAAAAALALFASAAAPPPHAGAATITSTLPTYVRDYAWTDPGLWSHTPALATPTYPNNGNLGHTYNVVLGGGSVDRDVNVTLNDLTLQGSLEVSPTAEGSLLTVNNLFRLGTASLIGPVHVAPSGRLEFFAPGVRTFFAGTLTISGAARYATDAPGEYRLAPQGAGTVSVAAGGTFTVNRPVLLMNFSQTVEGGPAGTLANAGLFEQQPGQRLVWDRDWLVTNSGTMRVNAEFGIGYSFNNTGLLDLQSAAANAVLGSDTRGGTMSGQVRLAAGANLTLLGRSSNPFVLRNVSFTNAGTIHLTGSTRVATATTIPGAVNVVGGTSRLSLSAPLTLTGPATVDGGTTIEGLVAGSGRATVSDLTLGAATLRNATLTVPAGGLLKLSAGDHQLDNSVVTVQGRAEWTGGAFASNSSPTNRVEITPGGHVSVPAGGRASLTRLVSSDQSKKDVLDNAGLLEVGRGGQLLISNAWRWTNTGTIRVSAGVIQFAGGLEAFNNPGVIDLRDGGGLDVLGSMYAVREQLVAGYRGGAWDGPGIRSDAAQADRATAVGYASPTGPVTFLGLAAGAGHTLVRHTKYGDANVDSIVNFSDLLALAKNYNSIFAKHWYEGDFNYDNVVNFTDLLLLARNYNQSLATDPLPGTPATFNADLAAAFAQVPEPSAWSVLALTFAATTGSRRRRRRQPQRA